MKYTQMLLLLTMLSIAGCATNGLSGIDYCAAYQPIMMPADPLPRSLEDQIITANELWEKHCNKRPLWPLQ